MADTKDQIINAMCLTWRHDFGLDKRHDAFGYSGMTPDEREALRRRMAQMFDHHIAPLIADNDSLRGSCKAMGADMGRLTRERNKFRTERDKLRADVEALRKDAERYRHMRGNATFRDMNGPGLYWYLPRFMRGDEAERLDRAIDEAIEREKVNG